MSKSIKEQIESKCIHFTGLGNNSCKKGINYHDVRDMDARPYKVPCLKYPALNGGHCDHVEFPSEEYVNNRIEEIDAMTNKTVGAFIAVKDHIKKTGVKSGVMECPNCKGKLGYSMAKSNGHIWAKCDNCDTGWMQ